MSDVLIPIPGLKVRGVRRIDLAIALLQLEDPPWHIINDLLIPLTRHTRESRALQALFWEGLP